VATSNVTLLRAKAPAFSASQPMQFCLFDCSSICVSHRWISVFYKGLNFL